jgi:hypothetical protein
MERSVLGLVLELVTYIVLAIVAAALIGALGAGVGQLVSLDDRSSNALGWGACLTAFAFLMLGGRPIGCKK